MAGRPQAAGEAPVRELGLPWQQTTGWASAQTLTSHHLGADKFTVKVLVGQVLEEPSSCLEHGDLLATSSHGRESSGLLVRARTPSCPPRTLATTS